MLFSVIGDCLLNSTMHRMRLSMAPSNSSANVVYAIFLIYFDDFAYDCFIIPIVIKAVVCS